MISSILIILFSLISLSGVFVFLGAGNDRLAPQLQPFQIIALTFAHLSFLLLGMFAFIMHAPIKWMIFGMAAVILSRVCNGYFLYGKNNWQHYLVTGGWMACNLVLQVSGL
ncbi:hypothetical protein ERJ70_18435 [Sediminibacillus dalangtanensis]|uniref:Uncharacterized protein n=1 Tax=Sediminibacillus dalangtanensis TaxID=2729421 RepID=A0ABX7VVV6_9BACI|nr:hypothetical protein [Sediminibacillus dalangtanensis]QTN01092.1 hypothetical protein ERJ70_18435 [Sediminibacillus dalangtanensis]